MPYKKGSEKAYFAGTIAVLVAIAAAIGFFLYQSLMVTESQYDDLLIEEVGDQVMVSPDGSGPSGPPSFEQPTSPPPSN